MKKQPFANKVVVVTGAASGIGAAICRKFGSEGSRIGILDADGNEAKAREGELIDDGIDAFALTCDVTDERECTDSIEKIVERFGGIDVLVNNAGITQRSPFVSTEMSVYRKVMEVNFFGSLHCAKAAIGSIIERKGIVIVTSSISGLAPTLGRTGYCASKHALHGFFATLRTELFDEGVHVMLVCPGFIKTNLQSRALDGDGSITTHPQSHVGKQGTPESVAEAVYRAAIKRKPLLVLSPIGKLSYLMYRFAPKRYESIMAKKLRDELARNER
jgi:NAD(P)-dependent dehydrogenase (short-subunit alcohol dehydrogenase family)